jgi:hypothetical protein
MPSGSVWYWCLPAGDRDERSAQCFSEYKSHVVVKKKKKKKKKKVHPATNKVAGPMIGAFERGELWCVDCCCEFGVFGWIYNKKKQTEDRATIIKTLEYIIRSISQSSNLLSSTSSK